MSEDTKDMYALQYPDGSYYVYTGEGGPTKVQHVWDAVLRDTPEELAEYLGPHSTVKIVRVTFCKKAATDNNVVVEVTVKDEAPEGSLADLWVRKPDDEVRNIGDFCESVYYVVQYPDGRYLSKLADTADKSSRTTNIRDAERFTVARLASLGVTSQRRFLVQVRERTQVVKKGLYSEDFAEVQASCPGAVADRHQRWCLVQFSDGSFFRREDAMVYWVNEEAKATFLREGEAERIVRDYPSAKIIYKDCLSPQAISGEEPSAVTGGTVYALQYSDGSFYSGLADRASSLSEAALWDKADHFVLSTAAETGANIVKVTYELGDCRPAPHEQQSCYHDRAFQLVRQFANGTFYQPWCSTFNHSGTRQLSRAEPVPPTVNPLAGEKILKVQIDYKVIEVTKEGAKDDARGDTVV